MQNARAQRADERKEETPFRRWSAVCIRQLGLTPRRSPRQKNFMFSFIVNALNSDGRPGQGTGIPSNYHVKMLIDIATESSLRSPQTRHHPANLHHTRQKTTLHRISHRGPQATTHLPPANNKTHPHRKRFRRNKTPSHPAASLSLSPHCNSPRHHQRSARSL